MNNFEVYEKQFSNIAFVSFIIILVGVDGATHHRFYKEHFKLRVIW